MSRKVRSGIVKKTMRLVFSRLGIITLLLILQFGILCTVFFRFEYMFPQLWGLGLAISAVSVIYLTNCPMNPSAKITWLIIMVAAPLFGSLLLIYLRSDLGHRLLRKRTESLAEKYRDRFTADPESRESLGEHDTGKGRLADYLSGRCYPVYRNTAVEYFPSGERKMAALLEELEKARDFIFLEYFIIDEGDTWDSVLSVLERKAREGVEVRVMYDGTCEFTTLPHNYPAHLKKRGIKCKMFSPATPFISTHYNYRDHRKIAVIDGRTAFCGGVNIADEYVNIIDKYGHWKDAAVMLRGEAVSGFTLMFLQMWELDGTAPSDRSYVRSFPEEAEGFVIPYADCPVDSDKTGERVYMDILNRATDHVNIMTPYLVVDSEMETALRFAAERGVRVTLILPGIPDKKGAWALAKTHYKALLDSGVHIYEYTPGFVHAKVFEADGDEAVVGTINLDYRSLYHHFECAVYMAYTPCIRDIEEDIEQVLSSCRRVTYETVKKEKLTVKLRGILLKLIAPLM